MREQDNAAIVAASRRVAFEGLEARELFSTYVVTNTNDSGSGSLRQAISSANSHAGADVINFAIGSGAKTISPSSALPGITDPVTLDGATQPGYAGKPLIEISGAKTSGVDGLKITGGSSTLRGLVINRFGGCGIFLYSKGGNAIKNCYIGTDISGTIAAPNKAHGIMVTSAGNTIGGTSGSASRNVISGNGSSGVFLYTSTATGNIVAGNYLGTNASGTGAIGNTNGVGINGAPNNTIGGVTSAARNVISGNRADGIVINSGGATGNKIQGNYVGLTASGSAKLGNGTYGVEIAQPNNVVGGTVAGSGNVISGNKASGVALFLSSATGNLVQGNYIGTDPTGTIDLGNTGDGVAFVASASKNTVGGTTVAARNVISGNDGRGVGIFSSSFSNTVAGNYIGTNAAGNAKLGNATVGVNITSDAGTGNVIGGTVSGAGNVISGNNQGVSINKAGTVAGNFIGTAASGTGKLGNAREGVYAAGSGVVIGGSTSAARNVIGSNGADGVFLNGASGAVVQGNSIGADASGAAAANAQRGILVMGSSGSKIQSNTIAYNAAEGVLLASGSGNTLSRNAIFSNTKLGININWDGVTNNDTGDGDGGPNGCQNFPVLTSAKLLTSTVVAGKLNSKANTTYKIEFFATSSADSTGYGEGRKYLGSTSVTTDGGGNATFTASSLTLTSTSYYVAATATAPDGSTSEFGKVFKLPSVVSLATSAAAPAPIASPFSSTSLASTIESLA